MIKSKNKWIYLLIGIAILIWSLIRFNKYDLEYSELVNLKIQLKRGIQNITGQRNKADYIFYAKKYNARFQILNGAISSKNRKYISNLKEGQFIEIKISKSNLNKLDLNNDINIYSIKLKNHSLLKTKDYNSNRKKYSNRIKVLFMFIGLLGILKGLNISDKLRLVVFYIGIALFIIFRIFNIGY
ncbi:hypothetical protein [uncultured Tenacibaculum sp.]|uniref:hypothetical protein n=1 Tax=uncultured Tenacibaculum sp. TaxID=174713 RepID=UPI00261FD325|nr:hypothetical protein [uncultured Tenacibaculum sp.]